MKSRGKWGWVSCVLEADERLHLDGFADAGRLGSGWDRLSQPVPMGRFWPGWKVDPSLSDEVIERFTAWRLWD